MRRRPVLRMLGASAAALTVTSSTVAAEGDGMQPVQGELPDEDTPHETVFAFPETEGTRETGQFLQLRNGWVFPDCSTDDQRKFFENTRQTFVYDGQTFVLDSFEDWEPYMTEADRFLFTHTDPPKSKGKTFQVLWDTIFTADFDNPCVDTRYEEGDRYAGFPFESSYEIVEKDD